MRIGTVVREVSVRPTLNGVRLVKGDIVELVPNDLVTMLAWSRTSEDEAWPPLRVVKSSFNTEYIVGSARWMQAVEYEGIHRPHLIFSAQYIALLLEVYTPTNNLYESSPFWSTAVSVYTCVMGLEKFFVTNDNATVKKLFSR